MDGSTLCPSSVCCSLQPVAAATHDDDVGHCTLALFAHHDGISHFVPHGLAPVSSAVARYDAMPPPRQLDEPPIVPACGNLSSAEYGMQGVFPPLPPQVASDVVTQTAALGSALRQVSTNVPPVVLPNIASILQQPGVRCRSLAAASDTAVLFEGRPSASHRCASLCSSLTQSSTSGCPELVPNSVCCPAVHPTYRELATSVAGSAEAPESSSADVVHTSPDDRRCTRSFSARARAGNVSAASAVLTATAVPEGDFDDGKLATRRQDRRARKATTRLPAGRMRSRAPSLPPRRAGRRDAEGGGRKRPCGECGRLYTTSYMETHMRTHTGERPFCCPECKHQYSTEYYLKTHIRRCHAAPQSFRCDACGRSLASRRGLIEHRRIHSEERPFQCQVCGKGFRQPALLFNHLKTHSDQLPFQCELCGSCYKYKRSMERHKERIHDGVLHRFPCERCERVFSTKTKLKEHRYLHEGNSPHVCEVCGKRLLARKTLQNHMLIHQGKKPFQCEFCPKAFRFFIVLKRHLSVHTGVKPFRCERCGRQFIHRVYMLRHKCNVTAAMAAAAAAASGSVPAADDDESRLHVTEARGQIV